MAPCAERPKVFLIGSAASALIDTPISEAGFTGMGNGIALSGARAIIEYQICPLVYLAFDQIVNQAQKLRYMMGGQGRFPVTYLVMASGIGNGDRRTAFGQPLSVFYACWSKEHRARDALRRQRFDGGGDTRRRPVANFPQAQLLGPVAGAR